MTSISDLDLARLLGPDAQRSPDMEAVWSWMVDADAGVPDWLTLEAPAARALLKRLDLRWNAELPPMAEEPLSLPGSTPIPARLLTPPDAEPGCILFLHGGGWAFGDLDTHARCMRLLAADAGRRVLAIDYRLAPEHPAPVPFEDCLAGWRALVERSREPAFNGPLAVAGDSAGANLALAVILNEIREDRRKPDAGLLFYGVYGADLDSPSYRRFAEGFGLTRAHMKRFWDWYAPAAGALPRSDPRLSPLEAPEPEVARLPPLFLNAAGLDPLLSDTVSLVRRLQAAGVPHRFVLHEGVHHGFMQMSAQLPAGRSAIREAAAFLTEQARV